MSKMITGSICITDLIEAAKKQHSAFQTSKKNGKLYANIVVWEADETDANGNDFSIQLNSTKEKRAAGEDKVYFGNMKRLSKDRDNGPGETTAATSADITSAIGSLPF